MTCPASDSGLIPTRRVQQSQQYEHPAGNRRAGKRIIHARVEHHRDESQAPWVTNSGRNGGQPRRQTGPRGSEDYAEWGSTDEVLIFLRNGDGSFRVGASYPVGVGASAVATGDSRRVGRIDLATANSGTNGGNDGSLSVLLGNGDGTFSAASPLRSAAANIQVRQRANAPLQDPVGTSVL